MSRRLYPLVVKLSCLAAFAVGIAWNAAFSIADILARRNQPDAIRFAMRLAPANAVYPAQLADGVYVVDPAAAEALLEQAVKLNGYDASSWVKLGLLYEVEGDLPYAEEALLRAASVDATFLPSWTLANFYFRRGNSAQFWSWARKAVQIAPGAATPLFRLAWYLQPDARKIEARLQIQRPITRIQFVNFLFAQGDAQAVSEIASNMLGTGRSDYSATILAACEWLMEHQHADLAFPLWNGLAASRGVPYPPRTAGSADAVTNGSFGASPLGLGFDWHLAAVEGVSSFLNANPNALGFEFSGDEPDSFQIMGEVAPVRPRNPYALIVDYSTTGITPASGIEWFATDFRSGSVLARTGSLSAEQGGEADACFVAPESSGFVNLLLRYERQSGTVHVEGKLTLKSVRLIADTAGKCKQGQIFVSAGDPPGF